MLLIKESVLSLKEKQQHDNVSFTFKLPAGTKNLLGLTRCILLLTISGYDN